MQGRFLEEAQGICSTQSGNPARGLGGAWLSAPSGSSGGVDTPGPLCLAQTRGDSFRGGMRVKEEGCGAGHVTGRSRAASFTSSAGGSLCKRHTLREGVPSGSTSPWSVLHLLDPEGQGRGQGLGGGLTPSLEQLARPGEQGAETEQGHLWGSACCRCLEVPDTSWPSEGVY